MRGAGDVVRVKLQCTFPFVSLVAWFIGRVRGFPLVMDWYARTLAYWQDYHGHPVEWPCPNAPQTASASRTCTRTAGADNAAVEFVQEGVKGSSPPMPGPTRSPMP